MITLIEFSIISTLVFIVVAYSLKKFYKSNKSVPIIGNLFFNVVIMIFIGGFYGIIFKGGDLIEQLNLERSEDLQLVAAFFIFLYGAFFMTVKPKP